LGGKLREGYNPRHQTEKGGILNFRSPETHTKKKKLSHINTLAEKVLSSFKKYRNT